MLFFAMFPFLVFIFTLTTNFYEMLSKVNNFREFVKKIL